MPGFIYTGIYTRKKLKNLSIIQYFCQLNELLIHVNITNYVSLWESSQFESDLIRYIE